MKTKCAGCDYESWNMSADYKWYCGDCTEYRTPLKRRIAQLEAALRKLDAFPQATAATNIIRAALAEVEK